MQISLMLNYADIFRSQTLEGNWEIDSRTQEAIDEGADLWWAGKMMEQGQEKKLGDYLGRNDKTKIVCKLQKKGAGAPQREPIIDETTQKEMMAFYHKKQVRAFCFSTRPVCTNSFCLWCTRVTGCQSHSNEIPDVSLIGNHHNQHMHFQRSLCSRFDTTTISQSSPSEFCALGLILPQSANPPLAKSAH